MTASTGTPEQAVVEAALLLLERMGLSPDDLVAVPRRASGCRAALPIPARRRRQAHHRGGQPGPQGRQAAASALHPPGRGRYPAGRDQPGGRHDRQRSRAGHGPAAATHRDGLPPRRRARLAPGRPRPGPVPDHAAGERRDGPLAAFLSHAHGPARAARPGASRTGGRAAAALASGQPISSRRYDHLWVPIGRQLLWVRTQQISTHWLRHTTLTWGRNFGYAVARAYAGHTDGGGDTAATSTYVRASLCEVATALAALTGEPHPGRRRGWGRWSGSPRRSPPATPWPPGSRCRITLPCSSGICRAAVGPAARSRRARRRCW
jgi:hypothetical protein